MSTFTTEPQAFKVEKTTNSRLTETDFNKLEFGKVFSDHMFIMDYSQVSWNSPRIVPFGKIEMSPATSVLHYGQAIFEGMKAHRTPEGKAVLFRPYENIRRMNDSATRMCMPQVPEEIFISALGELIKLDKEWIPSGPGSSLYIRPFMIGTDEYVGVKPSDTYKFIIFTCPVANYYKEPVNVRIETKYSRACPGGVGATKAAGNYGASLYPATIAQKEGYHQVIWTDAREHKYIEESGTMNVMFVIDGVLYTPPTSGTILPGVTRNSVLTIVRDWGVKVEEEPVPVQFVVESLKKGKVEEAFGVGTAATIAQIKGIGYGDDLYNLPPVEGRELSNKLSMHLDDYKRGKVEDKFGWLVEL